MTRRRIVLASLATLTLTLAACSHEVGGTPSASPSSPPASSTSSASGSDPFTNLNPCTLLDQALKDEGYPPAVPSSGDPKHACDVDKPSFGGVTLVLQAGQTYDSSIGDPSKAHSGKVNGRPSIQIRENLGSTGDCDVQMEVKPGSRAVVIVSVVSGKTDEACTYVGNAATKIEPLLPK